MKSIGGVFLRISLVLLFCLAIFANANSTPGAAGDKNSRKRCEKHCEETYKDRKHRCKQLRKWERKPCEDAAKEARGICKVRCR
jgi:hypothetical protein